jgi:large subunit ribosomal protein L1
MESIWIILVSDSELKQLVKTAREGIVKRNFQQSAEMTLILKDIDIKKGFNINEIVSLPNIPNRQSTICLIGSGDMGTRARKAKIDTVLELQELDRLGTNKGEARKLVREHDFFLSDTALMSTVGRSLGQFLGPKGKMPMPLPYGAPIETIATRLRRSVRVRAKNQLNVSARIGDEKLDDSQLVSNASAIIAAVEKKLPQGEKNIRNTMVKFTMSKVAKITEIEQKNTDKKGE